MSKENREAVEFKLNSSISLATKEGDYKEFDTITLFAPIAANRKQASVVKNFAGKTFMSFSSGMTDEEKKTVIALAEEAKRLDTKKDKKEKEEPFNGRVFAETATANGVDDNAYDKALDAFRILVTKGECAEIDGNNLTLDLFDNLDFDDMEAMFYQYSISFLLRSLLG